MPTNEAIIGDAACCCFGALLALQASAAYSIKLCIEINLQPVRYYKLLAAVEDELETFPIGNFCI